MIGAVLLLQNAGNNDTSRPTDRSKADVGVAESLAERIEKERFPIGYNDPALFNRPIWIQHEGDDPKTGWLAFDAAPGGCVVQWDEEAQDFYDCKGTRYPRDGSGLQPYLVQVDQDGHVIVDLDPDAITSTTSSSTTTTILITGSD